MEQGNFCEASTCSVSCFPPFRKPKYSLPFSQEPITGSYSKSHETSSHLHNFSLSNPL